VHDDLLEPLRAGRGATAILCDVDGTLAPIIDDPAAVSVPEPTRELLRELARSYRLVACVTGRRALEAREIVGVQELLIVGLHGFERLEPGAEEAVPDPAVAARAGRAREFLDGVGEERLAAAGLRREDKGAIQAVHWRGAPEAPAIAEARAIAEEAAAVGLVPRWGRKVLEIRPVDGIDKGTAAARVVDESGARLALFGGDDATDLDAMGALRSLARSGDLDHAVCVGVGSAEQPEGLADVADVLVDGTDGFARVLEALR
jgi:trehalose 6-phosphate phosphatase